MFKQANTVLLSLLGVGAVLIGLVCQETDPLSGRRSLVAPVDPGEPASPIAAVAGGGGASRTVTLAPENDEVPDESAATRWLRVVDDRGAAIVGARVQITRGPALLQEFTDHTGKQVLLAADRDVRVAAPGRATCEVRGAGIAPTGETRVTLPAAGSLAVTVLDSEGRRLSGVAVEAVLEESRGAGTAHLASRFAQRSGPDGSVRFDSLGDARYWLIIHPSRHAKGTDVYRQRPRIGGTEPVLAVVAPRNPMTYFDVRVAHLRGAVWRDGECVNFAVQVEGRHGLLSIHEESAEATIHGKPGCAVRCRVVGVKDQNTDPLVPPSAWHLGCIGQMRPLRLEY